MLLEFGAKNFFSFKDGFQISFRLSSSCPEAISKKKNNTNTLCIKGANASGKTNVFKALNFLRDFCCNSFGYKPEEEIPLNSFMNNDEPTSFYIVISIGNVEYRYELTLNRKQVISEKLCRKDRRMTTVVHRKLDAFEVLNAKFDSLRTIKMRKNASFISVANQYEIEETKIFYRFFQVMICNVRSSGLGNWVGDEYETSEFYKDNPEMIAFVKKIICKCDLGISDITINETTNSKDNEKGEQKFYYPLFAHVANGKTFQLPYLYESSGTKTLFLQLGAYQAVLAFGGILAIDEFDTNYHPAILPILVNLFEDPESNPFNAQFIFSTHNEGIMDKQSKYKTILVSKEENESFAYRLDEIPGDILRNDRPISPIYKSGKIGGVPKL